MKKIKNVLIVLLSFFVLLIIVITIPFMVVQARSERINTDYNYLKEDEHYNNKVEITNIDLLTQQISCGYAVIEMMSTYYGNKVSEATLDLENNGKVSTSSVNGFLKQINASITAKTFIKRTFLNNDDLLKEIYDSLSNANPVAIEWAAKYEGDWTLHFSLITGIDLASNNITVYNPYGLIENITIEEFISRSSFSAYEKIPLFIQFGFAFGAFTKNTIFYAKEDNNG